MKLNRVNLFVIITGLSAGMFLASIQPTQTQNVFARTPKVTPSLNIRDTHERSRVRHGKPTPTPTPAIWCKDTDGGLNYYVKGHISGTGSFCNTIGWDDLCANSSVLNEAHCGPQNQCFTDAYTCPFGCENGVCKHSPN